MNKRLLRKLERLAALTRRELSDFVLSKDCFEPDWACSCLVCSWVLEKVLKAHGIKAELCIGTYDHFCHAFVLVDGFVVDITATQFRNPEVVIEPFEGSDYKSEHKGAKAHKRSEHWPDEQNPRTYRKRLNKIFNRIIEVS